MAKQTDFKKIATDIYQNRSEHEQKIKEFYVNTDICSIEEFFKTYYNEVRDINAEITPSKDQPSIADFKEIFSTFEKYPTNLQKLKRLGAHKELNRTLAISKAHSTTDINDGCQSNGFSPQKILWEKGPAAPEIYKGFRQFKQSLNKLLEELKQNDLETDYMRDLRRLNAFAKDVEKICGVECQNINKAFNDKEVESLRCLVDSLEKAIYIDSNRNLFRNNFNLSVQSMSESLLEVLTYWLNSVGNYQEI